MKQKYTDKIRPFICLKVKFNNVANGHRAFNVNSKMTHTPAVKSTSGCGFSVIIFLLMKITAQSLNPAHMLIWNSSVCIQY